MSQTPLREDAFISHRLLRRTDTAEASQKRHVPENSFWQQTQHIFASAIQKEEYDPDFYIDVPLGENHKQSDEISKFLEMAHGPRLLLLVGSPGIGKSSLVQHFSRTSIKSSPNSWVWIYFDGNEHRTKIETDLSQLHQSLVSICFLYLVKFLAEHNLNRTDFLLDVFHNDASLADKAFLHADASVSEKIEIVLEHLEAGHNVKLASILSYLSRKSPGRVVLVLDNLDPLARNIQVEIVKQVLGLAASFKIKAIVTVRHKTEGDLSFSDPNIFSTFIRTPVQPPSLTEIIRKRVSIAIKHPDAQNAKLGEGAIQYRIKECPEFVNILVRGLSADGLQRVVQGVSNESVRQALRISLSIYASPLLDPKRIVARLSPAGSAVKDLWHDSIPNYIAVRSILLRTARLYEEEIAWVKNIFGTRSSDGICGPFIRLQLLRFLRNFVDEEIEENIIMTNLTDILDTSDTVINKEVSWLAKNDWIERPSRSTLALSNLGRFMVDEFVFHRDYLSCIATDVDMYSEFERRLISTAGSFGDNARNLLVLLEYLSLREMEMLKHLSKDGLSPYCRIFGFQGFVSEIVDRVLTNMEPLRPDLSVDALREGLKGLLASREIETIKEMINRFGRV